ncbi:GNAT family N-acetyltransferase [Metabacillus sp. 84]|uniref:GNAT family N-acetyltransferase n=1 Tax=unclassified Metabacillus TaxID=2675274 RepID=UPI003CF198FE
MLKLVEPDERYREEYMDFYRDWIHSGEKVVPWVVSEDPSDFFDYIQELKAQKLEENAPENFVPHSTYWLLTESGKLVGAANVRHRLNEYLRIRGGHIGYGIRPSERKKGYATAILSMTLERIKKLGLSEVLVTCDKDNIASEKTILKNGGVFEAEFIEEDGNAIKRFWIQNK